MAIFNGKIHYKHTKSYWKWPFIVDLPINSMVIFHSYVKVDQRVEGMAFDQPKVRIELTWTNKDVNCSVKSLLVKVNGCINHT